MKRQDPHVGVLSFVIELKLYFVSGNQLGQVPFNR